MKIECPECNVAASLDEFPNFPGAHICEECGSCFELESHLVFFEEGEIDREIGVPLGE